MFFCVRSSPFSFAFSEYVFCFYFVRNYRFILLEFAPVIAVSVKFLIVSSFHLSALKPSVSFIVVSHLPKENLYLNIVIFICRNLSRFQKVTCILLLACGTLCYNQSVFLTGFRIFILFFSVKNEF